MQPEEAEVVDLVISEVHDSHDMHYIGDGVTRACVKCGACDCHNKTVLNNPCDPPKAA
jgi:hypothetical protein